MCTRSSKLGARSSGRSACNRNDGFGATGRTAIDRIAKGMPRMSQYKLVTYQGPEGARAGLVVGETVFDLAAATGRPSYATMLGLLRDWDGARAILRDAAAGAAKRTDGRPLRGI